ncbi:MAG: efflux RND transporter periplasmic adaptor subunit [Acidobacteriaceae bacterium]|nr:efflux RND transporter periplasmic adaptor subunit [Acidobacteriaceae bacterium]
MHKILPLTAITFIGLLLGSCSKKAPADAAESAAAPVQVAAAEKQPLQQVVAAEAVLYPLKQANITPKISAPVARFLVQRGDHVHTGQLLAVLEDRDLRASAQESKELYDQAQAAYTTTTGATMPDDLTKAKSDVASALQALDAAKKVLESRQKLLREGAIAQRLVDDARVAQVQAKAQFDTAAQNLNSLENVGRVEQVKSADAQMQAAKAHYQSAEAQVSYAEIRSPLNGIIADRPSNIGEMASAGSPLFTVVDISRVVARANIPAQQASLLKVGDQATVSGAGGDITGKITVVSPAVDPSTTTLQVWVEAPNPGEKLKLGSTVQVSMNAGVIPDAVVVPASALLASDEGGEKVMIAGSDSLAHEQKVEVGVRSGDNVQILSGVKPGDRVITEGGLGLDDKAKIEVTKPGAKDEEK